MSQQPRRAFRIGRFLGVPVYLTWSWLLFVAMIVPLYTHRLQDVGSPLGKAVAISLGLALMWGVSVLLHEFGHVLAGRLLRCDVSRVELGFLGGQTAVHPRRGDSREEFIIAASGPAVSIALGLPGLVGLLTGAGLGLGLPGTGGLFVAALTLANLAIAVFNLLPGLPLDGGRIAVAGIWKLTGDAQRATVLASYIGQVISAILALAAFVLMWRAGGDLAAQLPFALGLMVMSATLWSMAVASRKSAEHERTLGRDSIADGVQPIDWVSAQTPLSDVVAMTGSALVFVYDTDSKAIGYVDRPLLRRDHPDLAVGQVATPLAADQQLPEAASRLDLLKRLRQQPHPWYVVRSRDGAPVGIVGAAALAPR